VTPRFSRAGRHPEDPWFRIGTLEFTSTVVVVAINVLAMFVVAGEGNFGPIMRQLPMVPDQVFHGQLWRVATWPFWASISLWTVLNAFFFWYFGTQLEKLLLRKRAAWLYLGCTLVLSAVGLALSPFVPGALLGLDLLQFMVLLIFIVEHPHARFLFNVPAWLIGLVLVGIRVLQYLADRYWFGLLSFVIGLAFCAVVAKSVGLFTEYRWLPSVNPRFRTRRPARRTPLKPQRSHGHGSASTVISGPWTHVSKDQAELDALLDKVSQHGIGALTDKDRARITELRERIRRG